MSPRTIFLSKLMGLFAGIIAITMAANREATVTAFVMLVHDPAALWVTGMVAVAAGLALVLCHNVWSGGAPTVVVTVVGWLTLLKGIAVLALPLQTVVALSGWLRSAAFLYVDAAVLLALGIYLASAGFKASRRRGP
jgi:hypothetical protein